MSTFRGLPVPSNLAPIDLSDWSAVLAAMGSPAPSAADTSGGLLTIRLSDATAYSASPPPENEFNMATT
uniref:Uncharacterized protein n=1 Tax=Arundo donax TaxID=35708 RepID=A0A0A9CY11_ARUDO